jgi:hypothetical protein
VNSGRCYASLTGLYRQHPRPLPYAEPDRLIIIGEVRGQQALSGRLAKTFASLAGFTADGFTLRGLGDPENVNAVKATANFLSTLGVTPFLGRDFRTGEDASPTSSVAILTYSFS